jgi:hypothetical protein
MSAVTTGCRGRPNGRAVTVQNDRRVSEIKETAVHEVAHAVVAVLLGLPVTEMTLATPELMEPTSGCSC